MNRLPGVVGSRVGKVPVLAVLASEVDVGKVVGLFTTVLCNASALTDKK